MSKNTYGKKLFGIALLAFLLAVSVAFLIHRRFVTEEYAAQAAQTLKLAHSLDVQVIDRLRGAAAAMAQSPWVQRTALGELGVDNPETLLILETTRTNFNAAIVYVMNAGGDVVACTPYQEGKTLTGNNYAFRPYFVEAMQGKTVLYPALGVTTLERGIYTSAPVYRRENQPAGVFVIKSGLGPVDHLLEDYGEPLALVSPEGVVFASNRPEWLFRLSRQPLSQAEMARLTESRQFADQPLQGLPGGLNLVAGFVTLDGERHGVVGAPVGIADSDGRSWQLLSVRNFQAAYPATLMIGVAAAIAAMTLILSLYLLGRHARAELEREVSANREYLATTLNSIGEAVIAVDTGGKVRHMNPVAEQLTGWSEAEALGRPLLEVFRIVNEETRAEVANPVDRVLREGMLVGLANHTLLIARDGTERPIADSAAPIRNEKGATIGAVLVFRDQTEERAAEKALRSEKAAAQQYLDIAGVMMVALDASANVILVNQKGCAILGYPEKEILGRNWFKNFLPTRVRESVKSVFSQIMTGQVKLNEYLESRILCRDGEERLIAWHNTVIRDEAGQCVGTLSSGEDITERRRAEEALGESEARYRTLFERTANPVLVIDTDGDYLDANAAALEFFKCTMEELLMKNIKDFVPPGHDAEAIPKLQALWAGGGRIEREYSVCGALKALDLTITPGTWQGKRVVFGVGTDITERKIAEEQRLGLERKLQQALKAESLGRMAGAIAHHFNNLLGVVMGNLELAIDNRSPGATPGVNLAEALQATHRAAEVSGLMLSYLGQRPGDNQPLDLVLTCRESLSMLHASLPGNVVLRTEFSDARPIIWADAAQMRQILTNLFANACEAMDAGEGEVRVAAGVLRADQVRADEVREGQVFPLDWEPAEDAYAYIEVADTGRGMDVKVRDRIFDPFFSTKFTGRGLGLAVVEGIIRSHEGAVTVRSAPGLGSTFRVLLPLLRCEVIERQPVAAAVSNPPEAAAKILLVEDEPMVRNMAQTMLERLGYKVLTAADGAEAVEVFEERGSEIGCVLLDLTMPRMDGWEALSVLRSLRPDLPVILSSGYDEAQVMAGSHPHRPQAFLHKPYQMADLKAALARTVSAPPAEAESG